METVSIKLNKIVNDMKEFQESEIETERGKMKATIIWSWIIGSICVVSSVIWVYDEYQQLPTPISAGDAADLFKRFIDRIAACVT